MGKLKLYTYAEKKAILNFKNVLRNCCINKGITNNQISEKICFTEKAICYWKNLSNTIIPNSETIKNLDDILEAKGKLIESYALINSDSDLAANLNSSKIIAQSFSLHLFGNDRLIYDIISAYPDGISQQQIIETVRKEYDWKWYNSPIKNALKTLESIKAIVACGKNTSGEDIYKINIPD